MIYRALATDYDDTIAEHGVVRGETVAALQRVSDSGRKLLLVTGRELIDLRGACSCFDLFHSVVCENGAVLFDPASGTKTLLADRPASALIAAFRRAGVEPVQVCDVMIDTNADQTELLREVIRETGARVELILNKSSVMVLPEGINKGTGLETAIGRLGLELTDAVAIGDAENDIPLLTAAGFRVAVANALPQLKAIADLVTTGKAGSGAAELIQMLLADKLSRPRSAARDLCAS